MLTLNQIARALGGEVVNDQVKAPGPDHSKKDRSLSITTADNQDGFVCHSFAGDDSIKCLDYVRSKLGLPEWKPSSKGNGAARASEDAIAKALQAAIASTPVPTPAATIKVAYDYVDADGVLLYQNCRLEPKDFRQRVPSGDKWTWKLDALKGRRVLYRLPELLAHPDATVFITEGEKDADNVAKLCHCATTVASHKWTDECRIALFGRDCCILEDNDDPGAKHAAAAAKALYGTAKSIRIVSLPGLGPRLPHGGKDVSDWLELGHTAQELEEVCHSGPLWEPSAEAVDAVNIEDFHAYMPMHQYIFAPTSEMWPAGSVNARVPPVPLVDAAGKPVLGKDGEQKYVPVSAWLDQNRSVEQMTWFPGHPQIIHDRLIVAGGFIDRVGVSIYNQYRGPTLQHGDPDKAGPWLDHVRKVYPDDADHLIKWLAHRVQRPHEKINHAIVLGGKPGIGKDTLIEPVKRAVGPWNVHEILPGQLLGAFNGFLKSVILRINEAHDLGEYDRYAFYDRSKAYIATPPDVVRVNEKFVKEYQVPNLCGVIVTTNHKSDGIYLPVDDRRHYVVWSELSKEDFDGGYWQLLYHWYDNGGAGHVAAHLAGLDIGSFDAKAPPPKTRAFWEIVDANRAPEVAEMQDAIDWLGNPNPDALTINQLKRCPSSEGFADYLKDRKNSRKLPYRLEACGYVAVRNADAKDGLWKMVGGRQVIYAKAALSVRDQIGAARRLADELR